VTVGVAVVALAVTLVAARPEPPALSRPAVASPTTAPTTTSTTAVGLPTPAPRDVPAGPLPDVLTRVPTTDPVVFLTIDDGAVRDPEVVAQIRQARVPV